jgi:hypothetical protein
MKTWIEPTRVQVWRVASPPQVVLLDLSDWLARKTKMRGSNYQAEKNTKVSKEIRRVSQSSTKQSKMKERQVYVDQHKVMRNKIVQRHKCRTQKKR